MAYFVLTDNDGKPLAFFNTQVHGERMRDVVEDVDGEELVTGTEPNPDCTIPDAAVAITDEQWAELVEHQGLRRWENGTVVPYEPPTPAITQADYSASIQRHLDATARERQYDGIQTAITYRDDPNPQFAAEGVALFAWRSAVWSYSTAELQRVMVGERQQPSVAEFIAELPPFIWPKTAD